MKVCIVSLNIVPFFDGSSGGQYGGAEVQAAVLADAFAAEGMDVRLVAADLRGDVRLAHPAVHAFDSSAGIPGLRFFHPRLSGILRALRRADADVYFQHCAGMITGVTAAFCRRAGRVFVYFAGSDTDFSFRRARVGNLRDRLLFRWGLARADAVVAQNAGQAEAYRRGFGRDAEVIPTAVAPPEPGGREDDGTIAWVGALREVKRPDRFVELARRLPDRRFVLVGGPISTEPDYGRRILEAARATPNVTATGRIPREEVDAVLRRAAVLVNTSRVEGFPNAFLEAWRHGTPVVSFVDPDGLIGAHGLGEVCGDLDAMAGAVARLAGDAEARAAIGRRARGLIERRYAAPLLARRYRELFERLVAGRAGGRR